MFDFEYLIRNEQIAHSLRVATRGYEKWALDRNDLKRYCQSQWLTAVLDNDKEILAYWDRKKQVIFACHSRTRYIRYFIGRPDMKLVERYNRKEIKQ